MADPRINWSMLWNKVSHPEHPSSWITGVAIPPCLKIIGDQAWTLTQVYMTDALPTELRATPAEMSVITLTDGSQALLQTWHFSLQI